MKGLFQLSASTPILLVLLMTASACTRVYLAPPGPPGRDGRAFFGIDYDYQHPYRYWDNNPSIPNNPEIGFYYGTFPGIYEFEYFINPQEYWYGTYQVWINPGGPGQPNGAPGIDGLDTYLMLICNPDGFYAERFNSYKSLPAGGDSLVVAGENYRIVMQRTTLSERVAHPPKYRPGKR